MSKVYSRRDSATAVLRKAGIDKADYNTFIKVVDGGFEIPDTLIKPTKASKPTVKKSPTREQLSKELGSQVEEFLGKGGKINEVPEKKPSKSKVHPNAAKNAKQITDAMAQAKKSSKKPPVKVVYEEVTQPAKAYRVDPNNITNTIKSLILDGKTNAEIWGIIQPAFNMADDKRHYPAWYRSQMKRKGQLS